MGGSLDFSHQPHRRPLYVVRPLGLEDAGVRFPTLEDVGVPFATVEDVVVPLARAEDVVVRRASLRHIRSRIGGGGVGHSLHLGEAARQVEWVVAADPLSPIDQETARR